MERTSLQQTPKMILKNIMYTSDVDFDKNIDLPSGSKERTLAYICMVSSSNYSFDIINNTVRGNFQLSLIWIK